MKRLLDYNPVSGLREYFEFNHLTGETTITTEQDVETTLDWTKALSRDESYSKKGIKNSFWHYATIPDGVWLELKVKHGIDWNDLKAIRAKIDSDYPHLKATTKRHT